MPVAAEIDSTARGEVPARKFVPWPCAASRQWSAHLRVFGKDSRARHFLAFPLALACAFSVLFASEDNAQPAPAANYLTPIAPRRLALVIGNAAYPDSPLPSAPLDVAKVRKILAALQFDVTAVADVNNWNELVNSDLVPFLNKVEEGDIVVIYYFGHGFSHGADNFLVPVKATTAIPEAKLYDVFLPERTIREMASERRPGMTLLFLDACRAVVQFTDAGAAPPLIAQAVPSENLPGDIIVSYASDYGHNAFAPQQGVASYFTDALVDELPSPGRELGMVELRLTTDVERESADRQSPYFLQSRKSVFYFSPSLETSSAELSLWKAALQAGTYTAVEDFLEANRGSAYAADARRWKSDHPASSDNQIGPRITYTRVSPLIPELVWKPDGQPVTFPQLTAPLAVARTLEVDPKRQVPSSASTVSSNALLVQSDAALVVQNTVARISPDDQNRIGRVNIRLPFGQQLSLPVESGSMIKASADIAGQRHTVVFRRTSNTPARIGVGRPEAEIVLASSPNLPSTVDPGALRAFIAPMLAPGRYIGWVSISTPATSDQWLGRLYRLQADFTEYLLEQMGVAEAKITIVNGLNDGVSGVRVRVFGN